MKDTTTLVTAGRHPERDLGSVNPPVYHTSTVLFPTLDALEDALNAPMAYGRLGTPTTNALEEVLMDLEGAAACRLAPSGLAAVVCALLSALGSGDNLLMVDTVYEPTRKFCDGMLKRMGVETTYYDPMIGAGIEELLRPETKVVFTESPGSRTFEVQDIPAIAKVAHAAGALVMMDNTWATPLYFKAIDHGVDVVVHAATKYIVGHADASLGTIATTAEHADRLVHTHRELGLCAGPDDAYLGLRGIRTLAQRLKHHEESALRLAEWFAGREEVAQVIHPARPDCPGHEYWKRDFLGSTGLFAVILKEGTRDQLAAMFDGYHHFGMGYSWGGFESLVTPSNIRAARSATQWNHEGPALRYHAGLEDPDDLLADLEAGFARFHAAATA